MISIVFSMTDEGDPGFDDPICRAHECILGGVAHPSFARDLVGEAIQSWWLGEEPLWNRLYGEDATDAYVIVRVTSPPEFVGDYRVDLHRVIAVRTISWSGEE